VYKGILINGIYQSIIDKTKIVIFRKSKKLYINEKWSYKNQPIEIVDQFCYLGLTFNYNGKVLITQKILAAQGRKACFLLHRQTNDFLVNIKTRLSMFDTYVGCILNYACEVWAITRLRILRKSIYNS